MIIQHNMLAINNLMVGKQLQKGKAKAMERLSSGYRINRAADDAANMAISEKMQSRIRALARCQQNIEEGISLAQTADGALNEVNNMLNRVNELCVQAANGTNTTEDRSKIAAEITQIYDDMDRIFEDTEFNTMKIFRHDGDNYYGPEPEYLYHESVTELPPGELHSWGTGMFPTKQFDLAKEATPATATLTLADGVDLGDAHTLDGTSFNINHNGTIYKIQFGTSRTTGSTSPENGYYINTNSYSTVQSAFNRLNTQYAFIDDITISGNQIKFTFYMPEETKKITYNTDTNQDGVRETLTAEEKVENGAKGNGISFYCDGNSLNPIGDPDCEIIYSSTATQKIKILDTMDDIDPLPPPNSGFSDLASYLDNLAKNSISLGNGISASLSGITTTSITTAGDLRQAITNAIATVNPGKVSATYNPADKTILVTLKDLADDTYTSASISESPSIIDTPQQPQPTTLPITIQTEAGTGEKKTKHVVQIPNWNENNLYALKINDSNYLIYNKTVYKDYSFSASQPNYYSTSRNYTNQSVEENFLDILSYEYGSSFDIKKDSVTGEITLTSKTLNNTSPIIIENSSPTNLTIEVKSLKALDISASSYSQEYYVPIDFSASMPNGFDATALYGTGFMLNNSYYQFTGNNDTSTPYNEKTTLINLDSVTSFTDLCQALASVTKLQATEDGVGIIKLTGVTTTSYSASSTYLNFSDGGPSGTFSDSAVSSGGTAYKNPQAEIDFSKYDMDNLDELYGTGFRLTCATCPGEFVNVVFCHDKSGLDYPESFEYTDSNGNTNTIHNYMVELKDVTDGSQIAAYIAEQLEKDLDHFTEVKVSDTNPAVLIAQDKRSLDQSGRGQVMAGVYTNFVYNVLPEKLPNLGDKVGGGRKDTDAYYAYCMIYAGDTKEKPYIAVHLPHFSVENLKLEYPKEPWDSYEEITDVMNRSKTAAEVVSMARSKIGADQNRLEHAFDYAANAEEQISDAMSRIKDADIAEEVTSHAKLTILSNAQEAMLSQIADFPERILPLLQQ